MNDDTELEREADVMGEKYIDILREDSNEYTKIDSASEICQCKKITESMGDLREDDEQPHRRIKLKYRTSPRDKPQDYEYSLKIFKTPLEDAYEDKYHAMKEISRDIKDIGSIASHKKFSNKAVLEAGTYKPADKNFKEDSELFEPFELLSQKSWFSGFQSGSYKAYICFAHDKYGYIMEVADTFSTWKVETPVDGAVLANSQLGDKIFSSLHDTSRPDDKIMTSAKNLGSNPDETLPADSFTKVVAEGARWNAVRKMAKIDNLVNNTKFFTRQTSGNPYYIPFNVLWINWDKMFESQWGITKDIIKNALNRTDIAWNKPRGCADNFPKGDLTERQLIDEGYNCDCDN